MDMCAARRLHGPPVLEGTVHGPEETIKQFTIEIRVFRMQKCEIIENKTKSLCTVQCGFISEANGHFFAIHGLQVVGREQNVAVVVDLLGLVLLVVLARRRQLELG